MSSSTRNYGYGRNSNTENNEYDEYEDEISKSGYSRPVVQWYPGHIAKAERMLQETIKAVDVVVEVRDARIPAATSHPRVAGWCAGKPRLVVLTHTDAVPASAIVSWKGAYRQFGAEHPDQTMDRQIQNQAAQAISERIKYNVPVSNTAAKKSAAKQQQSNAVQANVQDILFVNAKMGAGIHSVSRAILAAGQHVQERRAIRGLLGRPLRVGILGYPNVGKSALINRLLGRKRCKTANLPGVTRSLQWIRVKSSDSNTKRSQEFELLDSPGIIPAVLVDQSDAMLLAACNCIGEAAYDNQAVAAYLCEWLMAVHRLGFQLQVAPNWRKKCIERYRLDPLNPNKQTVDGCVSTVTTGEDMLFAVADNTCQGDPEDAARKILQDFRAGRMGLACLQVAPASVADKGQLNVLKQVSPAVKDRRLGIQEQNYQEQQERAALALETAKARGLSLPSAAAASPEDDSKTTVGKGLFDGW